MQSVTYGMSALYGALHVVVVIVATSGISALNGVLTALHDGFVYLNVCASVVHIPNSKDPQIGRSKWSGLISNNNS